MVWSREVMADSSSVEVWVSVACANSSASRQRSFKGRRGSVWGTTARRA